VFRRRKGRPAAAEFSLARVCARFIGVRRARRYRTNVVRANRFSPVYACSRTRRRLFGHDRPDAMAAKTGSKPLTVRNSKDLSAPMPLRLHVEDVSILRGGIPIVGGVSFTVAGGEALIIRGPNGAGKSTLLKAILGFLPVAAGAIRLEGGAEDTGIAEQAHSLGHLNAINAALTVRENLAFLNRFLDGPAGAVDGALERLNLALLADMPTGLLSAGQKRRAGLARLLVAKRPVWLLDEPTTSLDAASSKIVEGLVADHLAGGGLALIATHIDLDVAPSRVLTLAQAPMNEAAAAGWSEAGDSMAENQGGGR
jgi:heme exporter protein A